MSMLFCCVVDETGQVREKILAMDDMSKLLQIVRDI